MMSMRHRQRRIDVLQTLKQRRVSTGMGLKIQYLTFGDSAVSKNCSSQQ